LLIIVKEKEQWETGRVQSGILAKQVELLLLYDVDWARDGEVDL
jgi:hypothetical protein